MVKCKIDKHNENIVGICLKEQCDKKSRLVCFACAISHHADHAQHIVRLSDIQQADKQMFVKNWPVDKLAFDVFKYLRTNEPSYTRKNIDQSYERFIQSFKFYLNRSKDKLKQDLAPQLKNYEPKLK